MYLITESLQIKTVQMINTFSAKPKHKHRLTFKQKNIVFFYQFLYCLHQIRFQIPFPRCTENTEFKSQQECITLIQELCGNNVKNKNITLFQKGQVKRFLKHNRIKLKVLRISRVVHSRFSALQQYSDLMQKGCFNLF